MGERFRIRRAAADDLREVGQIEELAFPNPWDEGAFAEFLEAVFLVSEGPAGRLAGYAIGRVSADEGEVLNVAVAPAARRKGVGTGLLSALVQQMERLGALDVFLEVRQSNLAAIAMYRRHGFRVVGNRPRYYRNPTENALVMHRGRAP